MSTQHDPVLQAIRQRRSIRAFTGEEIPREALHEILEAGRWAPSGKNNQPCRFLVVQSGDPRQQALSECTKYSQIVLSARALICVFLDKSRMYHEMKDHQSAGACIQNMLLAIHALGYGAVWLGEIVNQGEQVCQALDISPDQLELQAVLAVGHPASEGASTRIDLADYLLEEL